MRAITKIIKVRQVECTIYDRTAKEERVELHTVAETSKMPTIPENCILIEQKILSEKEVKFSMSPEKFVALAEKAELATEQKTEE